MTRPNEDRECCPVCRRPEDRPAKIIAQDACCCFHAPNINFVPTPEQVEAAERWRVAQLAGKETP